MFTPEQRSRLRSDLLEHAAEDHRISAAAITGSAAAGSEAHVRRAAPGNRGAPVQPGGAAKSCAGSSEDQWSDIDLAIGVADPDGVPPVLADWTAFMYDQHRALHHVDVKAGAWIYRVFLLPNALQVDLAFVPASDFRALGPTFRLVFGHENEPRYAPPPAPEEIAGFAWLYALHARSAIARRKLWQAEYMISGIRDHALALACIRHGFAHMHGRGIDQLPAEVTAPFEDSLVRRLDVEELSRAFQHVTQMLIGEIRSFDEALAARLEPTLTLLCEPPL